MGGIIVIITVVFIIVMIRNIAAVALQLTGLDKPTANFQALSALTGTGFTTKEAELVLNHPMRRRIISLLMITGNGGMVAVIAGLGRGLRYCGDHPARRIGIRGKNLGCVGLTQEEDSRSRNRKGGRKDSSGQGKS